MPPELNPLTLVLAGPEAGIPLVSLGGAPLRLAAIPAGLFTALFWTALVLLTRRTGAPTRAYRVLLIYAVGATLYNAWSAAGGDGATSIAFVTALFAGSAVAVWLSAPLVDHYAPAFRPPRPTGGAVMVGVPLALLLLFSFRAHPLPSLVILVSVALGLLGALQLINAGLLTRFQLAPPALFFLATLLAILESFAIALLPFCIRMVYPPA